MITKSTINEADRQANRYETDEFIVVTDVAEKRQTFTVDANTEALHITVEPIGSGLFVSIKQDESTEFSGTLNELLSLLQAGQALRAIKEYLNSGL